MRPSLGVGLNLTYKKILVLGQGTIINMVMGWEFNDFQDSWALPVTGASGHWLKMATTIKPSETLVLSF